MYGDSYKLVNDLHKANGPAHKNLAKLLSAGHQESDVFC